MTASGGPGTAPEAFGELYDRHAPIIYRYAARRAGDFVADDVTSETFLVAWEEHELGVHFADGKFRDDIIVDPATGQLIGERTVYLVAEDGIPANTAVAWTSMKSSVVDSAP